MNTIYEKINDPGLVAWVILIQDSSFNLVTEGYCKQYAQTHPMSMRLLYDPSGDTIFDHEGLIGPRDDLLVVADNEDRRVVRHVDDVVENVDHAHLVEVVGRLVEDEK